MQMNNNHFLRKYIRFVITLAMVSLLSFSTAVYAATIKLNPGTSKDIIINNQKLLSATYTRVLPANKKQRLKIHPSKFLRAKLVNQRGAIVDLYGIYRVSNE